MNKKYAEINERIFPYEVLFLATIVLYLFAPVRGGDDMWFITTYLTNFHGNLKEFLAFRYETWSTRLLLEVYTLLLLYFPILYCISMPIWLTAIAAGFNRLLEVKDHRMKWGICLSLLLLPISFHGDVGFVCTTVNYVFAFACLLWAVIPVIECQKGKKVHIFAYIGSIVLMVLGCNMEYYCPPFLIYSIYLLVRGIKTRKGFIFPVFMILMCIGALIYAFSAPASTVSAYNETNHFFPGYELLSTADKLQAGFVATAGGLTSTSVNGNTFLLPTLVLGLLLAVYGIEKQSSLFHKIISCVPFVITILTGGVARFLPDGNKWKELFFHTQAGWKWDSRFTLIVAFVFFASLLFGLFRVDKRLGWGGLLALFCRTTMGASSSVFASGLRTFYPLFFVICVAIGVILCKIKKREKPALAIFYIGMIVSYTINILYVTIL